MGNWEGTIPFSIDTEKFDLWLMYLKNSFSVSYGNNKTGFFFFFSPFQKVTFVYSILLSLEWYGKKNFFAILFKKS